MLLLDNTVAKRISREICPNGHVTFFFLLSHYLSVNFVFEKGTPLPKFFLTIIVPKTLEFLKLVENN